MPEEIQGREYYRSKDGKFALSWNDAVSGWGLGVVEQLGNLDLNFSNG